MSIRNIFKREKIEPIVSPSELKVDGDASIAVGSDDLGVSLYWTLWYDSEGLNAAKTTIRLSPEQAQKLAARLMDAAG